MFDKNFKLVQNDTNDEYGGLTVIYKSTTHTIVISYMPIEDDPRTYEECKKEKSFNITSMSVGMTDINLSFTPKEDYFLAMETINDTNLIKHDHNITDLSRDKEVREKGKFLREFLTAELPKYFPIGSRYHYAG